MRTLNDEDLDAIEARFAKVLGVARSAVIDPNGIYSTEEAARLVNYHVVTIREKLRDGVIQGRRRHGGTWRVRGSELLKLA